MGRGAWYCTLSPRQADKRAQLVSVASRQQDLQPEFGLLPDNGKKEDDWKTTMILVLKQPREPASFRGSPGQDPEDWLEKVEPVRIFNRWDDGETYRLVFFHLEDTARAWFENHQSYLTDWTLFKSEFLKTFATVVRKERDALLLETRPQHPNEGVVIFVEEVKQLFHRADPEMTEEQKLRFLVRGVKEELFARRVRNPPKTVAEFVIKATKIEKALEMRASSMTETLLARGMRTKSTT